MSDEQKSKPLNHVRRKILDICYAAKSGHIASSLSVVEIIYGLYDFYSGDCEKFDFILSKGHAAPCLYSVLNDFKILGDKEINSFCKFKSPLTYHVSHHVSGVNVSSGALGMGLSVGIGMCLANKLDKNKKNVYILLGDGEINEGSVWESLLYASAKAIENIVCLIDSNRLQASGATTDIIDSQLIFSGIRSLGWEIVEVEGHNLKAISDSFKYATNFSGPIAIIFNTIKGKAISFMENNPGWHHRQLNDGEYELALKELIV